MTQFERDANCSITITVQFYYVVEQGSRIEEADIRRAIDVCEEAYKGCSWDGNLMDKDLHAAFAKNDSTKLVTAPPSAQDLLGLATVFPGTNGGMWPQVGAAQVAANPNEPMPPPKSGMFDAQYNTLACLGDLTPTVRSLPSSEAGCSWLHEAALARLSKQEQLDTAFHLFRLSNDLYTQLNGRPWSSALYNMACCQSVAVTLQIQKYRLAVPSVSSLTGCLQPPELAGGIVAPELPPRHGVSGNSVASLCEARLDAAMIWLSTAIGAGNCQYAHMASDPDLQALREMRAKRFWAVLGFAQSMA